MPATIFLPRSYDAPTITGNTYTSASPSTSDLNTKIAGVPADGAWHKIDITGASFTMSGATTIGGSITGKKIWIDGNGVNVYRTIAGGSAKATWEFTGGYSDLQDISSIVASGSNETTITLVNNPVNLAVGNVIKAVSTSQMPFQENGSRRLGGWGRIVSISGKVIIIDNLIPYSNYFSANKKLAKLNTATEIYISNVNIIGDITSQVAEGSLNAKTDTDVFNWNGHGFTFRDLYRPTIIECSSKDISGSHLRFLSTYEGLAVSCELGRGYQNSWYDATLGFAATYGISSTASYRTCYMRKDGDTFAQSTSTADADGYSHRHFYDGGSQDMGGAPATPALDDFFWRYGPDDNGMVLGAKLVGFPQSATGAHNGGVNYITRDCYIDTISNVVGLRGNNWLVQNNVLKGTTAQIYNYIISSYTTYSNQTSFGGVFDRNKWYLTGQYAAPAPQDSPYGTWVKNISFTNNEFYVTNQYQYLNLQKVAGTWVIQNALFTVTGVPAGTGLIRVLGGSSVTSGGTQLPITVNVSDITIDLSGCSASGGLKYYLFQGDGALTSHTITYSNIKVIDPNNVWGGINGPGNLNPTGTASPGTGYAPAALNDVLTGGSSPDPLDSFYYAADDADLSGYADGGNFIYLPGDTVDWTPAELTLDGWFDTSATGAMLDGSAAAITAQDAVVATWVNLGDGPDLVQSDSGVRPLINYYSGFPAVSSPTSTSNKAMYADSMLLEGPGDDLDNGDDFTICFAAIADSPDANSRYGSVLCLSNNSPSSDPSTYARFETGAESSNAYFAYNMGANNTSFGSPVGVIHIVFLRRSAGNVYISFNGSQAVNAASAGSSLIGPRLNILQRGGVGGGTSNFAGGLFEIVADGAAMSDSDRDRLVGYLAHKYGIESSLPSDHPYKSAPPTMSGGGGVTIGTATFTFSDATNIYNITIESIEQETDNADYTLDHEGVELIAWTSGNNDGPTYRFVENVSVTTGDEFVLTGNKDGTDDAKFVSLTFDEVPQPEENTFTPNFGSFISFAAAISIIDKIWELQPTAGFESEIALTADVTVGGNIISSASLESTLALLAELSVANGIGGVVSAESDISVTLSIQHNIVAEFSGSFDLVNNQIGLVSILIENINLAIVSGISARLDVTLSSSGVAAFYPDIADIIEEAYERAGMEVKSGYDVKTAIRSLNHLSQELSNEGINLWTVDLRQQQVKSGGNIAVLPHDVVDVIRATIREGATDTYIEKISFSDYNDISDKSGLGRPVQYYMHRGSDVSLYLWPVPDREYTFSYFCTRRMHDAGSVYNLLDVPERWVPVVVAGLAYHLSLKRDGKGAVQRRAELRADYLRILDIAKSEDRDKSSFYIVPGGYD